MSVLFNDFGWGEDCAGNGFGETGCYGVSERYGEWCVVGKEMFGLFVGYEECAGCIYTPTKKDFFQKKKVSL